MKYRVAGLIAGAFLIVAGVLSLNSHSARAEFDAALWRSAGNPPFDDEAPRLRMADGLLKSGALLGKTRSEVGDMLGPQTTSSKFREFDLVYWLGPERSFVRIDSEWLVMNLGPDGRVENARIVTD
jgi:hypothetical protein